MDAWLRFLRETQDSLLAVCPPRAHRYGDSPYHVSLVIAATLPDRLGRRSSKAGWPPYASSRNSDASTEQVDFGWLYGHNGRALQRSTPSSTRPNALLTATSPPSASNTAAWLESFALSSQSKNHFEGQTW
ncbi:hypothetical protein Ga0100231_006295 [Opitutaceae bacterium TAV4]|nr:hypothetical protein Ga0100231_006295 [Opitutaceae bacterium TAV4]